MVRSKHVMKHNWLEYKPVQHWYQRQGTENGMKPIHKHDQGGVSRGYLLRETPQRLLSWNNRKKSLSPGCKEMLLEKMKEIEAFNASRVFAKARNQGKGSVESLSRSAGTIGDESSLSDISVLAAIYRDISAAKADIYNTRNQGKGSASTQKEKRARCYICKIRGHVFWKCPNKKKKIMNGKAQGESFVVNEHNKFLDKYFESIEPKDEGSLVKGLEELEWDRKDVHDYVDEEYISWNGSLYSLK
ncbi:ARID DNA-binding domain-containing protein, partial [Tanacetum coccineum]